MRRQPRSAKSASSIEWSADRSPQRANRSGMRRPRGASRGASRALRQSIGPQTAARQPQRHAPITRRPPGAPGALRQLLGVRAPSCAARQRHVILRAVAGSTVAGRAPARNRSSDAASRNPVPVPAPSPRHVSAYAISRSDDVLADAGWPSRPRGARAAAAPAHPLPSAQRPAHALHASRFIHLHNHRLGGGNLPRRSAPYPARVAKRAEIPRSSGNARRAAGRSFP
jgi:hypothetical protein